MDNKVKTLVWAFPGTGKTETARLYKDVADPDHVVHPSAFWYSPDCSSIVLSPFMSKTLLCRHSRQDTDMAVRNEFILAYPSLDCVDEYIERYKRRGDLDWYREVLVNDLRKVSAAVKRFNNIRHTRIVLEPRQYLADALIENGVCLEAK